MDLKEIRNRIDVIDDEILKLFTERMETVKEVAEYKRAKNLPTLNSQRERDIIARVTDGMDDEMASYTKSLYSTMFEVSRSYQNHANFDSESAKQKIKSACLPAEALFPKSAVVACQGVEGSNSQIACDKLFDRPKIMYLSSFDSVFTAVDKGLCRYGILPIENSLHGSVTQVYDLMKKYSFHIVRSARVKIDHMLLANPGVKAEDIKEIYSHEQALAQCSEYLKELKNVKIIPCENTAVAAKMVLESGRSDVAAISSKNCAELYNLCVLNDNIQNSANNYTRFICIAKELEIYPGANKISVMLNLPHRPGSLYEMISKFSVLGVNLTKLESRPIPGRDFEFTFYVDFDASVYSEEILTLVASLEESPDFFSFLGNYSEI
ncbi:MAG: bifunctional chorismate mutase/prephenate dehydratase [Ruminococcaceae bacterium]|nr:bifunctional chorismate mutase/prephenate dehydratase [Oscillospiraceae bacterium]